MSAAEVVADPARTPGSAVHIKTSSLVGLALVAIGLSALIGRAPGPDLSAAVRGPAAPATVAGKTEQKARDAYGKLPLAFVPNAGQTDARVRYSAHTGGASFYFTEKDAVFSFAKGKKGAVLRLAFLGANPTPRIEGRQPGSGRVNYLLGNDPASWHTNLPTYGQVVYRDLWPGVDMRFRGSAGRLKYEFHLRPGAKASDIRLGYRGSRGLSVSRVGELLIQTPLGTLRDQRPRSYQQLGGRQMPVESRFVLERGTSAYGFVVGNYDARQPLVIDPGLIYSTFLGGTAADIGRGIAVDGSGNAYVTGETNSNNFPTTIGAFQTTHNGNFDAFVTKLNAAGSAPLVYSTYLGGSGFDRSLGIVLDAMGSAYLTGETASTNFPTTPLAFDQTFNGLEDAFVTKLNPVGSTPLYSTYLGGSCIDEGQAISLDAAGDAHVVGVTCSTGFPTTPGAFDSTFNGDADAFVTKLNPVGSAPLLYSTYLGGSGEDVGSGIAVDAADNAHVTGGTTSGGFPTTPFAVDTTHNGGRDAFVTKLNPVGSAPLVYSTYLGGGNFDSGVRIAVDATGSAYATGITESANFPTTPLAFDVTHNGGRDAYVTKLHAAGSAPLLYSTFLGGSAQDQGHGIAVDAVGSAYVTGATLSVDFPITPGAFDTTHNGSFDAFVTKVNPAGSAPLLYSTFLGASGSDVGNGIDFESSAYVTGNTDSASFPTTPLAYDTTHNGNLDAFVTNLDAIGLPAVLTLSPPAATNPTGTGHTVTATVTDVAAQRVPNVVVRFTVMGAHNLTGSCTTGPNGQCTFSYTGTVVGTDTITAYADSDNDSIQDPGEPTGGPVTKTWIFSPACPPGDDDEDDDGLEDRDERLLFFTLLGDRDSDDDGRRDGDDDEDGDGRDDEDEDDGSDDECANDSDGDGEDDEDEDDDDDEGDDDD